MGKANLYTVTDCQTGEVLAKGTAGELEASGIVPKGYHTSEWAKRENNRTMGRKYNISSELLHPEDKPRRGEKGRAMNVYTCYDAAGNVLGEGTSRELWEAGVFGDDNGAYYAYNQQGGRCIKRGIAKMTCRKEVRQVSMHNARSEKPPKPKSKKPKLPVLRRIKDPTSTSYSPRQAETFLFDISEDLAIAPADKRFVLQPFDEVYIRRSPGYSEQKNAEADGEVLFPGQYVLAHASQRLSDLVRQAGGFTEEAYVRGASVQRKLTPDEMAKVKATLEIARTNQDRDSVVQDAVEIPEYYSIGVDVEQAVKKPGSSEDIVLREGDRLFVPKYNGTVRISGAVLYQNSVAYEGKKLKNYVAQAGGFKQRARRRPFIVYMNGKVASTRGGFLWKRYPAVEPGCQIVVPMKQEPKGNGLANAIGMMSSTASLAAMVASIINLSK